jgi:NAD(P)-dependent dehydrogenase (short-subunit alcohol dehydrogenase family)
VAPLWEQAPSEFRRVVDVNLIDLSRLPIGGAACAKRAAQSGRIVNISSIQAKADDVQRLRGIEGWASLP